MHKIIINPVTRKKFPNCSTMKPGEYAIVREDPFEKNSSHYIGRAIVRTYNNFSFLDGPISTFDDNCDRFNVEILQSGTEITITIE